MPAIESRPADYLGVWGRLQIILNKSRIGNADYAFKWAEKALEIGVGQPFLLGDRWTSLHDDPRWETLLTEAGIFPDKLNAVQFEVTLPY